MRIIYITDIDQEFHGQIMMRSCTIMQKHGQKRSSCPSVLAAPCTIVQMIAQLAKHHVIIDQFLTRNSIPVYIFVRICQNRWTNMHVVSFQTKDMDNHLPSSPSIRFRSEEPETTAR